MASRKADLTALHQTALGQFDVAQTALAAERDQCVEDRRFVSIAGAQWEGRFSDVLKKSPRLELNKVQMSVTRIINEFRASRLSPQFSPRTEASTREDDISDLLAGMWRADVADSDGHTAFDVAFGEAVQGGIGAFRLRARYEDSTEEPDYSDSDEEEDDDERYQRIAIDPIFEADTSVFFDLDSKSPTKDDARFCFVVTSMTPEAYEARFGEKSPKSWDKQTYGVDFDWCGPDVVYVAEYYLREKVPVTVEVWVDAAKDVHRFDADDLDAEDRDAMEARGWSLLRKKKVKRTKVRKLILDGARVLKDCGHLPGRYIPIIPVYGLLSFVDNIERVKGHVRDSKDAQRLKNIQVSALAAIAATSSREKPVLTPEQVLGHEDMWSDDSVEDYAYLLVNASKTEEGVAIPPPPINYSRPATVPPVMGALIQQSEQDLRDILGRHEEGEKLLSGSSGVAIESVQRRIDSQSSIYISNFARALAHAVRVWMSMLPDVYREDARNVKVVDEENGSTFAKINKPRIGSKGELLAARTFDDVSYDVHVAVGPSSSSARQATGRNIMSMVAATEDPEIKNVLLSFAIMNSEGEGISDIRQFFRRRLVTNGVVKPTEVEAAEMAKEAAAAASASATKTADPQAILAEAMATEAQAKAQKAQADAAKSVVDGQKIVAETAETKADIALKMQKLMRGGQ